MTREEREALRVSIPTMPPKKRAAALAIYMSEYTRGWQAMSPAERKAAAETWHNTWIEGWPPDLQTEASYAHIHFATYGTLEQQAARAKRRQQRFLKAFGLGMIGWPVGIVATFGVVGIAAEVLRAAWHALATIGLPWLALIAACVVVTWICIRQYERLPPAD